MSIISLNNKTVLELTKWHENCQNEDDKPLLKIAFDRGRPYLQMVHSSELALHEKIIGWLLSFFGQGTLSLNQVIPIAQQAFVNQATERNKERFNAIIGTLNEKITSAAHNSLRLVAAPAELEKITEITRPKQAVQEPLNLTQKERKALKKTHLSPLVGQLVDTKQLAEQKKAAYAPGHITEIGNELIKGYELLDPFFEARTIRGDGHCFFRALFASLICHGDLDELAKNISTAVEQQTLQQYAIADTTYSAVIESLSRQEAPLTIMQDPHYSNCWVELLRKLATNWWRDRSWEKLDMLEPAAIADTPLGHAESRWVVEEYLDNMAQMRLPQKRQKQQLSPEMGGVPEMLALSSCLRRSIGVLDVCASGREQKIVCRRVNAFSIEKLEQPEESLGSCDSFIFLEDGHFSCAIKKR